MYTKQKITDAAERLFFSEGIANIRLQQIADAAGISVGNLAYHFRNKEALVKTVYENLFSELADILTAYIVYANFAGFDKLFSAMYNFYVKNKFTFNNSWEIERNYPEIRREWLELNSKVLLQLKKRIEYNVESGLLKKEPYKGAYETLAQNLLHSLNSWIPQQMLLGKPTQKELYKRALWNLLYPYFSEKGIKEYQTTIAIAN